MGVWAFAALYAVYGVALLASLFTARNAVERLTAPVRWNGVILAVFALTLAGLGYRGMRSHLSTVGDTRTLLRVPDDYYLAPSALVAYFGTYYLLGSQPLAGIGGLVAFVQAIALGLLLGVFSRPLVPTDLPERRTARYLEHHLYNWWRSAQVAASFVVAFGVGIATASFLQVSQESGTYTIADLALLSIVTGISGIALGLYTLAKLYSVGRTFREELADDD